MSKILVTGAGGFIGHHLVKRLKSEGHFVRGIDIKHPEYEVTAADEFFRQNSFDEAMEKIGVHHKPLLTEIINLHK